VNDRARGAHLRPVLEPGPYAVWWWLVVTVAGTILVTEAGGLLGQVVGPPAEAIPRPAPAFVMVLVFAILGELSPVVVSERNEGVSLSWAFLFAALLFWGLALALLALTICVVVTGLARRKRAHLAAFNLAQWSLAYAATWWLLEALGWEPLVARAEGLAFGDLTTVLGAAVCWYAVNTVLVGVAVGLLERRGVLEALLDDLAYFALTTGAVLALAPVIVVLLEHDWRFLPFLLVPLSMVHHVASIANEREQRALRDELTGLGNRALFVRRFEELEHASRGFALCLLDLDRFKPVNDTHGHAVGDEVLRRFGGRLRSILRGEDTAARLGGDEFAILLEVQASDEVERTLRRIVDHLTRPYDVHGLRLEVGVSYGIARCPEQGRELGELLVAADARLYDAKRSLQR
jgi:diguanylate cyclase